MKRGLFRMQKPIREAAEKKFRAEGFQFRDELLAVLAFLQFLRNPNETAPVFIMENLLIDELDSGRFDEETKELFSDEGLHALNMERHARPTDRIEILSHSSEGSLGKCMADMYIEKGFDPSFYPKLAVVDKRSFLLARARGTHDIYPVLTGAMPNSSSEKNSSSCGIARSPLCVRNSESVRHIPWPVTVTFPLESKIIL